MDYAADFDALPVGGKPAQATKLTRADVEAQAGGEPLVVSPDVQAARDRTATALRARDPDDLGVRTPGGKAPARIDYAADWDKLPVGAAAASTEPAGAAPAQAQTTASRSPGSPAPEVIATVGSSIAAHAIGGLHGLYKLVTEGPESAANTVRSDVEALTYKPTGERANAALAAIEPVVSSRYNPINYIPNAAKAGAEKVFEKTNSPAGAVAAEGVGNLLGVVIPGAVLSKARIATRGAETAATAAKPAATSGVNYDVPTYVRNRAAANTPAAAAPAGTSTPASAAPTAPYGSVGASAATNVESVKAMAAGATPELKTEIEKAASKPGFNAEAAKAHIEADSLPVPVRLTEGQATQNPILISKEMNERGKHAEYVERLNQQNQQLKDNLNLIRDDAAPDAHGVNHVQNGEIVVQAYRDADKAISSAISAKYKALEDANGGQFPMDGVAFADAAEAALAKKLKTDFVSGPVAKQLERFKNGAPMNFETFEAMRTNLAAEIRRAERAGDGNAAYAAGLVREALESIPMPAGAEHLKPLADAARAAAKARFDMIRGDPAYKGAISGMEPDKFIEKFVVGGTRNGVATMVKNLGEDSVAHQTMKAGVLNYLKRQSGVIDEAGNFSQHGYNKALDQLRPKLNVIFKPNEIRQLEALGNTARRTQFQPRGSYVNNSNTFVAALGAHVKNAAVGATNYLAHGLPVGTAIKDTLARRSANKDLKRTLQTGAGIMTKTPF